MAMREIDANEAVKITKGKSILETELTKALYREYNGDPIITKLRELAAFAIEQLVVLGETSRTDYLYSVAVKDAGANLEVLRFCGRRLWPFPFKRLRQVLDNRLDWTAADCSDLIRLYGGVIEHGGLIKAGEVGSDVNRLKEAQRLGGEAVWGRGARARLRIKGGTYLPAHSVAVHTAWAGRRAVLRSRRDPARFAGIENTRLLDVSTVKKIDFVFGLPEGCDISGTTADSIFFMKQVNAFALLTDLPEAISPDYVPLVQLLPLATMASQGHHTVLECALTLTLNGIIDYQIGFYSSLMPSGYTGSCAPRLRSIFERYERDVRNKHILCYWDADARRLRGFEIYGRSAADPDLHGLREASRVGLPFLMKFKSMGYHPGKDDVLGTLAKGLALEEAV